MTDCSIGTFPLIFGRLGFYTRLVISEQMVTCFVWHLVLSRFLMYMILFNLQCDSFVY